MNNMQASVSGQLRLAAPPSLGRYISREIIPHFLSLWPDVSVSLKLSYDYEDLFKEGLDLAFRMGINRDDTLIERPLGFANRVIVAAPSYLSQCAEISSIDDLIQHKCLQMFDEKKTHWALQHADRQHNVTLAVLFQCTDMDALKNTLISGVGIAHLPWLVVRDEIAAGHLTHILPQWSSLVYPSRLCIEWALINPPNWLNF